MNVPHAPASSAYYGCVTRGWASLSSRIKGRTPMPYAIIQKASHFLFRDVFVYKTSDTWKKTREFALRFLIYKMPDTLRSAIFIEFLKLGEGCGIFYGKKKCTLRYIFIGKKKCTFRNSFKYRKRETFCHIFVCKKQCTLRYVYIYIIHSIVLIPNHKRTYDQNNQTEK